MEVAPELSTMVLGSSKRGLPERWHCPPRKGLAPLSLRSWGAERVMSQVLEEDPAWGPPEVEQGRPGCRQGPAPEVRSRPRSCPGQCEFQV